jgi:hypothetical protein
MEFTKEVVIATFQSMLDTDFDYYTVNGEVSVVELVMSLVDTWHPGEVKREQWIEFGAWAQQAIDGQVKVTLR